MAGTFSRIRLVFVGAIVIALAFIVARLSDCVPGLGSGGGASAPDANRPATKKPPVARGAGDVAVTVVGTRCTIADGNPIDCEQACQRLKAESEPARRIEIDATGGSHGTVEALKSCLTAAGFSAVHVRSDP